MVSAFIGTGIGGCIIVDGKIIAGSTANAGEIGHVVVKAGGPKCGCGQRGCLESVSSKTAIASRIAKAVKKKTPTVLEAKMARKGGRLKSGDLAEAVDDFDPVAVREVRRAAHFLGLGLGGLVNILGPEIVVVGGGVAQALGEPWLDLVRASARRTDPHRPGREDPDRPGRPRRRRGGPRRGIARAREPPQEITVGQGLA